MKTTYVCEFCGKLFEDMDECLECERSHTDIHQLDHKDVESLYKAGESMPEYILAFNDGKYDVYARVRGISQDADKVIKDYMEAVEGINNFVNNYEDDYSSENKKYKYYRVLHSHPYSFLDDMALCYKDEDFKKQYAQRIGKASVCWEKIKELFLIKK